MKVQIIYEDNFLKVVEKPAGVLAYPLPNSDEKTIGDMVGAMPVHRLDRNTSGILILAKSNDAKAAMQKLFKERQIEKRYKALVWGKVEPNSGTINIPLGRGTKDRLRVVPAHDGREAVTEYAVEKYFCNGDQSLLDVNLKTGRTHQIRVHFNAIGHPVVGDCKYSKRKSELKRQFLHAYKIEFKNPFDGRQMEFKSELPKDLESYMKKLE